MYFLGRFLKAAVNPAQTADIQMTLEAPEWHTPKSSSRFGLYVQIVVHDGDVQADVVHAVWGDVEDDGLVVGGIQSVLLDARLLLLQAPPVAYERDLDVGI